ncbi:MAG: acyl-CoA thioesterase [Eubacteriales bacterium]|nr:acyl-CoA thioesterase [Eubacteriales bacterium]
MSRCVYEHKVQYYETDQMGIVHHSNYIRWFEEARVDALDKIGMGYKKMEEAGVISPVLEVHATYKTMTHFGDTVKIAAAVQKYNGIILEMTYEVRDKETEEIRCTGSSRHCFLDRHGKPVSLKKSHPNMDQRMRMLLLYQTNNEK